MRKSFTVAVASIVVLMALANTADADIVFQLGNYPSAQNGFTLNGSITVRDSAIGSPLRAVDVTAWNFSVTNGNTSFAANSTDPDSSVFIRGTINVTPTGINFDASLRNNEFRLLNDPGGNSSETWLEYNSDAQGNRNLYTAQKTIPQAGPNNDIVAWLTNPSDSALGGNPWVIGTAVAVPEPSQFLAMSLVGLFLVACGWLRRNR